MKFLSVMYLIAWQYHHALGGLLQDKKHALELYRTAMKHGHEEAKQAFQQLEQELLFSSEKTKDNLREKPNVDPASLQADAEKREQQSTTSNSGSLLDKNITNMKVRRRR